MGHGAAVFGAETAEGRFGAETGLEARTARSGDGSMNSCRFFGKVLNVQEGTDFLDRPELTIGVYVEGGTEPILVYAQLVGEAEEALREKVAVGTLVMLIGSVQIGTPPDQPSGDPCLIVDWPEVTLMEDIPPIGSEV